MKALLLIDLQNDYFPGGKLELFQSEAAAAQASLLLKSFRNKRLPIFHVQHISVSPGVDFFLPGTSGVEIHQNVQPLTGEPVVNKHFPNSFRDTDLLRLLREADISELVIAGMMTHMCVDTTVRAAFDLGFTCTLAHDACATMDLSFEGQTISAQVVQNAYLAALGWIFAEIKSVKQIVADQA